ncbi:hypothetical protein PHYSODRAFT_323718 [Phytophthora sojae]|uniref:Uncharacterized protein n=1 Tax=Phytophthora sojae (strain P6497) TaxID=1094619 RepID=G4YLE6_PHYSP|nr:hypothetical protein PHYSODRAFT_323718 [Phytophthora sojae]EGZ30320.1 hypothetical protein PHYSODRAFT_323718 [Phytophthora sojae]|eukprot:XP_009517595.1 hypothetical protein PHYSODRAFT_323718 [Phytophthora sojae]
MAVEADAAAAKQAQEMPEYIVSLGVSASTSAAALLAEPVPEMESAELLTEGLQAVSMLALVSTAVVQQKQEQDIECGRDLGGVPLDSSGCKSWAVTWFWTAAASPARYGGSSSNTMRWTTAARRWKEQEEAKPDEEVEGLARMEALGAGLRTEKERGISAAANASALGAAPSSTRRLNGDVGTVARQQLVRFEKSAGIGVSSLNFIGQTQSSEWEHAAIVKFAAATAEFGILDVCDGCWNVCCGWSTECAASGDVCGYILDLVVDLLELVVTSPLLVGMLPECPEVMSPVLVVMSLVSREVKLLVLEITLLELTFLWVHLVLELRQAVALVLPLVELVHTVLEYLRSDLECSIPVLEPLNPD